MNENEHRWGRWCENWTQHHAAASIAEPKIRVLGPGDCNCPNDHPELDEFVAYGVTVHFEAMGPSQFWIGIDDPVSGRSWHINCGAEDENAKGYAQVEEQR